MDIDMPILNGYQSTAEIRKFEMLNEKEEGPSFIVGLSGYSDEYCKENASECGMNIYSKLSCF
jgi:CheY-like chemotaxis protein